MKPTYYTPSLSKRSDSERTTTPHHIGLSATNCALQGDNRTSLGRDLNANTNHHPIFNAAEFLALSGDFFRGETKRSFAIEGALFAIIVGISTWPIVLMAAAIAKWIK